MVNYLSDYYHYEPKVGYTINFKSLDGSHNPKFICRSLWEGECSREHCSYCAGWEIEDVPDEFFDTEHRKDIEAENAREYYSGNLFHEAEADEILNNMLLTGNYKHDS